MKRELRELKKTVAQFKDKGESEMLTVKSYVLGSNNGICKILEKLPKMVFHTTRGSKSPKSMVLKMVQRRASPGKVYIFTNLVHELWIEHDVSVGVQKYPWIS